MSRVGRVHILALIIFLLGMTFLSSLFVIRVFAAVNPEITFVDMAKEDKTKLKSIVQSVNAQTAKLNLKSRIKSEYTSDEVRNFNLFVFSESTDTVAIVLRNTGDTTSGSYIPGYTDLDTKSKQEVLRIAITEVKNSDLSQIVKTRFYKFISSSDSTTSSLVRNLETDTNPNFYEAYNSLGGVLNWVKKGLGIVSIVIFTFIGITLVFDLAYINIPIFPCLFGKGGKLDEYCNLLFSSEAVNAYLKSAGNPDDIGERASAMSEYIRSKSFQLILLFICLLYLVSGKLYVVLATVMDMLSGVLPE